MENQVDKKGIIKALTLSLLLALVGIAVLGWQYRRIEKEEIPALEEKIEQNSVKVVFDHFMRARINRNEAGATQFLTERAVEDMNQGAFTLIDSLASYEILSTDKLGEETYRYAVKITETSGFNNFVEIIIMTKILDNYYVDSVQLAG
ncbi:MAG: hypothetical protein ABH805_00105 [Candidatus Nealsonbacteria bacterium]